jgi:putative endonuclease
VAKHNILGQKGEDIAAEYLLQKGYTILHRNMRIEKDEIDIIAQDKDFIVFVEVKTRSSLQHGSPTEQVNPQKEAKLIRAANRFLENHEMNVEARFDVISVILSPTKNEIRHVPDAFSPGF